MYSSRSVTTSRNSSRSSSEDILNKKVPSNPKYKHVKTKLDTGASMSKYIEKVEDMRRNYRYRKDEIFKRMKISTFVTLVIQVHSLKQNESLTEYGDDEDTLASPSQSGDTKNSPVPSLALTDRDDGDNTSEISTARSTLQSVIRGVGEFNINDPEDDDLSTPRSDPSSDVPYLLLDLRDPDDFEKCHIISAKNYPAAMLSRSVNNFTNDILQYNDAAQFLIRSFVCGSKELFLVRNKAGRIIVMYDEDERIATKAATTFAQRGFDNTFLLSGGLKVAAQKFPHSLITGTLPASCVPPPPPSYGRRKGNETPPQTVPASQKDFTEDDIFRLKNLLDEALLPSDTGSRLNRASRRSRSNASVSSSRTSTSMSSASSQPWK